MEAAVRQPELRRGKPADAAALAELDLLCFAIPWSENSFLSDLGSPDRTFYLIGEVQEEPQADTMDRAANRIVIGYGGFWQIDSEGEIMNIAVHPDWRRQGLAGRLLDGLIEEARSRQLRFLYLEVRAGNRAAQSLYKSRGFTISGCRKKYYADNDEDAIIMLKNIH